MRWVWFPFADDDNLAGIACGGGVANGVLGLGSLTAENLAMHTEAAQALEESAEATAEADSEWAKVAALKRWGFVSYFGSMSLMMIWTRNLAANAHARTACPSSGITIRVCVLFDLGASPP